MTYFDSAAFTPEQLEAMGKALDIICADQSVDRDQVASRLIALCKSGLIEVGHLVEAAR